MRARPPQSGVGSAAEQAGVRLVGYTVSQTHGSLAIHGGPRVVPGDLPFYVWPWVTRQDEEVVLASLRQDRHACGPHARMLQEGFAAWHGRRLCLATNGGPAALHLGAAACATRAR